MKKMFFVVAAISIGSQLQAQEDTLAKSLSEVVITATRFPKKTGETGKVITVIGKTELERAGGKDLSQILNEQAGLVINGSNSNPGKDKSVFLRGARTAYTVILINGIPVNDPTGIGGAFDLRMLPVEQVEKIEILKGAQSTLYGSDAVAGVINIITKKSDGRPVVFYGGLSAGNYATLKANAGLSGETGASSYNVIFTHHETNGVSEAKDTLENMSFPKNGLVANAVSMDFDGRIATGLHLKPFFRYSHFRGTYADGAFSPAQNKFRSALLNTGLQAQYTFAKGSVTGTFSYDEVSRSYLSSFGNTPFKGNKQTTEIFGHYDLTKKLQALAGIRFDRFLMNDPSPAFASKTTNLASPFVSLFLKNVAGFNLEVGGRYNNHSQYGDNFTYSINPSYLVNNNLKLFANYGTAFKAPAISELFGQYGANPDLKPERSHTFEAGAQASFIKEKLDLRAVYFRRKIKDVIDYDATFTYINYDEQDDHGLELEASVRATEKLSVKIFYAYVTGEVTTSIGNKDTTYFNLIRRPEHSGGINLSYQATPKLFLSTHAGYFGKRNDLFYNASTGNNDAIELDAYALWDMYGEYAILKKKVKLFAQVNNILDKEYYEVYGFTTVGRNFTGGFRFKL